MPILHCAARERGILALLLAYVCVISLVQALGSTGLVRWSGYSLLVPLVASALLPFRLTLFVNAVTLAASVGIYGFLVSGVSAGGRFVVTLVVALASVISLVVCRVRLEREEQLRQATISRARLALLSQASDRVGSTLDVVRTAEELADVAVPRFGDFASVDLLDATFQDASQDGCGAPLAADAGPVVMRRAAHRSVLEGTPEAVVAVGAELSYPKHSAPAVALETGTPRIVQVRQDAAFARWMAQDPERARLVELYGIHSMMIVPLCARGVTLGIAVFIRHLRAEPFDEDDLVLAGEIAARAAVCIDNARRYTRERETALTLQRSLLPRALPHSAAVDVAYRYLPADSRAGVGGDWFDVIPLSSARVALVVGDVVGHGVQASATMGRLRSAVHTLADIDLSPDELLTHLDDLVIRLLDETGTDGALGATCLYAVYDPASHGFSVSGSSHPPPAVIRPDGTTTLLASATGPPLGLGGLPFECSEVTLPEGSVVALYTDGLVESRERDIDAGLDDLQKALGRPAASLEDMCDNVLEDLLPHRTNDDVALLLARTRVLDADHVASWDLPVDPAGVGPARRWATRQLAAWGLEAAAFVVELVVSELITNAIRYGAPPMRLRLIRDDMLICEVSDGNSTSPHMRRARVYDEGGRGLFLVAQLSKRWGCRQTDTGKTIWAEYALN
ncbi:SpoIIE family protein phosphatase [Streptomyces sp. NPDC026672]|uniref:ATP-binding SpoIIE family protein phosphatase n=1 Tax=unclassified Streptomyces TaxID=2593676 RepID=UPI0033CD9620